MLSSSAVNLLNVLQIPALFVQFGHDSVIHLQEVTSLQEGGQVPEQSLISVK